jgi:hypothetical protein
MTSGTTVLVGLKQALIMTVNRLLLQICPYHLFTWEHQTKFSYSNGQLRFGTTVISTSISGPAAGISYLAPMVGDNAMSASGVVHYSNLISTQSCNDDCLGFYSDTN